MDHRISFLAVACALLPFLSQPARAQQGSINSFINPPYPGPNKDYSENKLYKVGQVIDLKWQTNYPEFSLAVWQDSDYPTAYNIENLLSNVQTFDWTVAIPSNFDTSISNGKRWLFFKHFPPQHGR